MGINIKRKFSLIKLLGLLPVLFIYNNCDGFKSIDENRVTGSTTCKLSPSTSLKLLKFKAQSDCLIFSDISCESRQFSPEVKNSTQSNEFCIESQHMGSQCLSISERTYDTSNTDGTPEDFVPGGSYNYKEYNCYNKRLTHNNQAIFQSSDKSLKAAIDKLYLACINQGGE